MKNQSEDKQGYHHVTRWLHLGLALGVILQISIAFFMAHPDHHGGQGHNVATEQVTSKTSEHHQDDNHHIDVKMNHLETSQDGNHHDENQLAAALMETHRTVGVLVALIVLLNVIWAIMRRGQPKNRQISVLFSKQYWGEAMVIAKNLPHMLMGKSPMVESGNALALIVEMLGLLTMSVMAFTGFLIWNTWAGLGTTVSSVSQVLMEVHGGFAVVLFIYLGGHISMALLHVRSGDNVFARIVPWKSSPKGK